MRWDDEFKYKLQSLGALRLEAWDMILSLAQHTTVAKQRRFVRKIGTLGYVSQGVLKEYDALDRSNPAIINFIGANQCFITQMHNHGHYLEASTPCVVHFWDFDDLQILYNEFRELRTIYDELFADYDASVMLRMRLLEMAPLARIIYFRKTLHSHLPFLQKKEMSNYLHLDYNYFVRNYRKIL